MKISNTKIGPSTPQLDTAKTVKSGGADGAAKGKPALGPEQRAEIKQSSSVNVSPRAQQMQRAKDIASADTIDEAKVARLQKMIDEGAYKVDAESIADRLVDEHMLIPD